MSGLSPFTTGKTESKFLVSVTASRIIDSLVLRCEPLILLLGLLGRICVGSLYGRDLAHQRQIGEKPSKIIYEQSVSSLVQS